MTTEHPWLTEGATVAVLYIGKYTSSRAAELHQVRKVNKVTCVINTGERFSLRTLDRDSRDDVISFGKLRDPKDSEVAELLAREALRKAEAAVSAALGAYHCCPTVENASRLAAVTADLAAVAAQLQEAVVGRVDAA